MKAVVKFNSIQSFETRRLRALRLQKKHLDLLTIMHTNSETMATLGGVWTDDKIKTNLEWNLKRWDDDGFGLWLFFLLDNNKWIGRGGIRTIEVEGKNEIELAYALLPEYWQQGYATEIARACVEIGFEILQLKSLISLTLETNFKSQHVMEKAGFKFERNLIIHFEDVDYPSVLYRLNREEYTGQ